MKITNQSLHVRRRTHDHHLHGRELTSLVKCRYVPVTRRDSVAPSTSRCRLELVQSHGVQYEICSLGFKNPQAGRCNNCNNAVITRAVYRNVLVVERIPIASRTTALPDLSISYENIPRFPTNCDPSVFHSLQITG